MLRWQLLRPASSAAANHRAACRAKSNADCTAMLSTAEEADKSALWLEMTADELTGRKLPSPAELPGLISEAGELVATMVAPKKTVRCT